MVFGLGIIMSFKLIRRLELRTTISYSGSLGYGGDPPLVAICCPRNRKTAHEQVLPIGSAFDLHVVILPR